MQSFIEDIVQQLNNDNEDLTTLVYTVPSKRAGLFLKKAIFKTLNKTIITPKVFSIEELVEDISGLTTANTTTQLFELYQAYLETGTYEKESFEAFITWAPTLLQDINEIDRYLVNAKELYGNLAAIQELNHWSVAKDKTQMMQNYLQFWSHLSGIYSNFNDRLLKRGLGHQGLVYKKAVENLSNYLAATGNKHVFIGFNALNTAETTIIQGFLATSPSLIFWDLDSYFLEDVQHDAGYFIRNHKATWPFYKTNSLKGIHNSYLDKKNINIIGVPKNVSQVQYVGQLLNELQTKTPDFLNNAAVVLGDEQLLNPLLNSIPNSIKATNITMGQNLSLTPLYSYFIKLMDFHSSKTIQGWYYMDVLTLLSHTYTQILFKNDGLNISHLVNTIKTNNWTYILPKQLKMVQSNSPNVLNFLFGDFTDSSHIKQFLNKCIGLIDILRQIPELALNELLIEQLFKFQTIFIQLQDLSEEYGKILNLKSLVQLFKQLVSKETLDFTGNPVEGIQIMGMLESRLLDFETVILTSVNEGILPSGKSNNSFIPFDLKIQHGLPTYKEKDAVYTYHFYRLLQRAKNIYLIYNTEPDVLEGGEKSRLILQLLADNNRKDINELIATPSIYPTIKALEKLEKTNSLITLIKNKAAKGFSPSSLSNYIRNPMDFYKQNLLYINDVLEVEEDVAANTFGTIVHDSLEELYTPLIEKTLTKELLQDLKKDILLVVRKNFVKTFKEGDITNGKNYISFHVVNKYITNVIDTDIKRIKRGNFKIKGLELDLKISLSIPNLNYPIVLKGKLDRIEEENGITTIIDYKTGKVESRNVEIIECNQLITDYSYSKAFQLLCYSLMYTKSYPKDKNIIKAGIISMKNFNAGTLLFARKESARSTAKNYNIDTIVLSEFEQILFTLIQEIGDKDIPFIEKEI